MKVIVGCLFIRETKTTRSTPRSRSGVATSGWRHALWMPSYPWGELFLGGQWSSCSTLKEGLSRLPEPPDPDVLKMLASALLMPLEYETLGRILCPGCARPRLGVGHLSVDSTTVSRAGARPVL